jgi:Zn-dependent M28 family amino/carboxypeptidase
MKMKNALTAVLIFASCASALGARGACGVHAHNAQTHARPASKTIDAAQLLDDVRLLSADAMEGRGTGTKGGAMARAFIVHRFASLGLKAFGKSFEKPFRIFKGQSEGGMLNEDTTGTNVVGYLEGRTHAARYIVVTAHYDHLGVRNGQIYNGADDNASGVAALLQIAAHFARARPENSVIFAALDGEELGLLGAKSFVAQLRAARLDVALDVNMDMVSHSDAGELYAAGAYQTPALAPPLKEVAQRARVKLLLGHDRPEQGHDDWTNQSDQYAFQQAGIPFVYFGVEDHKDYHKPTDDFETITQDFFVHAAETILDAVETLDSGLDAISRR